MDDFHFVKRKNRRHRRDRGKHFAENIFVVDYVKTDHSVLFNKVLKAQQSLEVSSYLTSLLEIISNTSSSFDEILCYGLGSFSESDISRSQLAALLQFKAHYNCKTSAYDPVFNPDEVKILSNFAIEVLSVNDEAKRKINSFEKTLVYFAHCSSQLVNNFLWANWSATLHNCVILSNSFSKVIERNDDTTVNSLSCIKDIIDITEEIPIANDYEVSDAFNDLSIHSFPSSKEIKESFWAARPEPNYTGQTIEFCTKEVVVTLRQI